MQQNLISFMENYFVEKKVPILLNWDQLRGQCMFPYTAQVRERPTSKNIVPILTVHKNGKLGLWYIDLPAKRRWKWDMSPSLVIRSIPPTTKSFGPDVIFAVDAVVANCGEAGVRREEGRL